MNAPATPAARLPLAGCRVLDLGIITAGAATSALLADLGAEVIKVESPSYRDPFRIWKSGPADENTGDRPLFFRSTNRNKAGISIDLKQPGGRAAFLRLVEKSDVVVENFRRGVLERLGLGMADLAVANPRIILASVSSQGENGPDAAHVSYGTTLEAVAGLAWLTGYEGDAPVVSGRDLNYPDQVAALFSAAMVATAWRMCRASGAGTHLDISQRELTSYLVGEAFMASTPAARRGNSDPAALVQDCFRAADGAWVAVTVLPAMRAAVERLLDLVSGQTAEQLRGALTAWIAAGSGTARVAALVEVAIPAALSLDGNGVAAAEGEFWHHAIKTLRGVQKVKGFPFTLATSPLAIHRDAPHIGEDTRQVLTELGGYSDAEIDALAEAGVIELGQSA